MLDLAVDALRLAHVPPPAVASFVPRGRGTSISMLAINCRIGQRQRFLVTLAQRLPARDFSQARLGDSSCRMPRVADDAWRCRKRGYRVYGLDSFGCWDRGAYDPVRVPTASF